MISVRDSEWKYGEDWYSCSWRHALGLWCLRRLMAWKWSPGKLWSKLRPERARSREMPRDTVGSVGGPTTLPKPRYMLMLRHADRTGAIGGRSLGKYVGYRNGYDCWRIN